MTAQPVLQADVLKRKRTDRRVQRRDYSLLAKFGPENPGVQTQSGILPELGSWQATHRNNYRSDVLQVAVEGLKMPESEVSGSALQEQRIELDQTTIPANVRRLIYCLLI